MTAEIRRRGSLRPITDLPATADPTGAHVEVEIAGHFYSIPEALLGGGGDPALEPLGTELASYSSEFLSDPGFTWLNQGTSAVTYALNRAIIAPQAGGAGVNNLRLLGPATFPVAPFAVRTRFFNYSPTAGQGGGLAVYRTTNARIYTPNVYARSNLNAGPAVTWAVNDWSSFTTINATRSGPTNVDPIWLVSYLQVRCDGTTLFFDVSPDNARFTNISSTALATYLGGTGTDLRVMLIGNDPTAGGTALVGYNWFRTYGNANLQQ